MQVMLGGMVLQLEGNRNSKMILDKIGGLWGMKLKTSERVRLQFMTKLVFRGRIKLKNSEWSKL